MHQARTLSIGVDVHQDTMAVADVANAHATEGVFLGTLGTRPWDLEHVIRPMPSKITQLSCVSEAGPCGTGSPAI